MLSVGPNADCLPSTQDVRVKKIFVLVMYITDKHSRLN
jgi:hypothetical protein